MGVKEKDGAIGSQILSMQRKESLSKVNNKLLFPSVNDESRRKSEIPSEKKQEKLEVLEDVNEDNVEFEEQTQEKNHL